MRRFDVGAGRRKAAVAPFAAFVMVILVGMLAFSIDIGWIALVKTDLQTAADAAALAGAEKLQALYVNYITAGLPGSQQSQGSVVTGAGAGAGTYWTAADSRAGFRPARSRFVRRRFSFTYATPMTLPKSSVKIP